MLLVVLTLVGLAVSGCFGIIGLDIRRSDSVDFIQSDRHRLGERQVSQTLDNQRNLYFANVTLGTPPQGLRMHLDTGSSDFWCNSPQSSLCMARSNRCNVSGTYDSTASSSYKFVNNKFNISYVDGSAALGDYVTDTISIGGQSISDFQFGVGTRSSSTEGVLGIGYAINEVQVRRGHGSPYHNLPQRMVDEGFIKSNAYSLWLNDLGANTGQILFGGVNTDKYHGSLQTVPILTLAGQYSAFLISLDSISVDGVNVAPSVFPAQVLLDSGSTLMYLPDNIVESIYNQVHAATDSRAGSVIAYVPCALANEEKTIDFTFSGIRISVPFNEVVLPSKWPNGADLHFNDGTVACIFGVAPSGGSYSVLGDTFLRSAYVVYDLDNNQISLAQTNFNSTTDNIKEIEVGPTGVPDATLVSHSDAIAKGIGSEDTKLAVVATPTDTMVSGASTGAAMPAGLCLIGFMLMGMGFLA
ncbi:hypothetical protein EPUS_00299 [Endocarpon pusillum Z07020]|uniref:Probable aspartic-type endopeptidase OPSB n=1 Tax=Endocarpon pusillum (strain Z07020 / HMAS-L-300199) TaxID=1263415 RepID=U1FYW9_ENDPU|nr:uncharacterized protein EPUS_00299 [Endocarpon pusillum Z07020]ERF70112.1 hypothetical protein EPUS_00299 [Endocarpon pusillum Z07020]